MTRGRPDPSPLVERLLHPAVPHLQRPPHRQPQRTHHPPLVQHRCSPVPSLAPLAAAPPRGTQVVESLVKLSARRARVGNVLR